MPNLIDKPQLQATAQVAKSYVDAQDTANVNTIINALQQSGGGTGKQEGVILGNGRENFSDFTYYSGERITLTSNSGATIYYIREDFGKSGTIPSGGYYSVEASDYYIPIYFFTPATNDFTAASNYFSAGD